MTRPRRWPRSDSQPCPETSRQGPLRLRFSPRDDPGRLLEITFLDGAGTDDPETVVLAWLAILPNGLDPPDAARRLHRRLTTLAPERLTPQQARLLSLLDLIAAHRRA